MAHCNICGEPAGMFRSVHEICKIARDTAITDINKAFRNVMLVERRPSPPMFKAIVERIAKDGLLRGAELQDRILAGLGTAISTALEAHELTQADISAIQSIMESFGINAEVLETADVRKTLLQASILADLSDDSFEPSVQIDIPIPIALKRDETVVWVFHDATRIEPKTTVSYKGNESEPHGVLPKAMKDFSYRIGASKGRRVETTHLAKVGLGNLFATTQSLYFVSDVGTKKIALSNIIAVENFSDGVSVSVDQGKEQYFMLDEATFASNLIIKLCARL